MAISDRGFGSMDAETAHKVRSMGGKAAHEKGTGHEWDSEAAREAGKKGGIASGIAKRKKREALAALKKEQNGTGVRSSESTS